MRVDRQVELLQRQPVLHRERRLGDEVRRARADDVSAEQLPGFWVSQDFRVALRLAEGQGAAGRREGEATHLDRDALFLGFLLAQPDVRDLGVGVDAVRRRVIVGHPIAVAGNVLHRAHAFVRRDVGEHDAPDHVTDGPDPVGVGVQVLVHDHAPAIHLHAGFVCVQALSEWHASDGQQDLVGVHGATFAPRRELHLQAAVLLDDPGDLAVGVDFAAQARQVLGVDGDQVAVDHGEDLRQHLEHGHLAAQRREHRRELHADDAAAYDGEPPGDLLQLQDLVRVDRELRSR